MTFDLTGVDASVANAFRRIMISEVRTNNLVKLKFTDYFHLVLSLAP